MAVRCNKTGAMNDEVEEALKQQNRNLEFLKHLAFKLAELGPEEVPSFHRIGRERRGDQRQDLRNT
jgi:hypothetical protein